MSDKVSVLYFDDESVLLDIFGEVFGGEYDVLTASTLAEARQILSRCPDIVISDMSMPEITGTEFLREAARICPASFRILLTGRVSVFDVIGEVTSGVVQVFISKPWTEAEMRQALDRAAADRRGPRLRP
jgi:two-component system sensor histidine kinase/response regulator